MTHKINRTPPVMPPISSVDFTFTLEELRLIATVYFKDGISHSSLTPFLQRVRQIVKGADDNA